MCLVDTGYASFSAFDELKGQTPFLSPRPEELFNRTKRDGKKREGEKRGRNEERRGKKKDGEIFSKSFANTLLNYKPFILTKHD